MHNVKDLSIFGEIADSSSSIQVIPLSETLAPE